MNELQVMEEFGEVKRVYCLVGEQIDLYWSQIEELLKEVPGFYDYYTSEWTHGALKKGQLQVWALEEGIIRGIVLTRVLVFPVQKVLEVMAISGEDCLSYLPDLDEVFEKLAQSAGCGMISGLLRPGLARKLRSHLVEVRAVVVSRPVRQQREQ